MTTVVAPASTADEIVYHARAARVDVIEAYEMFPAGNAETQRRTLDALRGMAIVFISDYAVMAIVDHGYEDLAELGARVLDAVELTPEIAETAEIFHPTPRTHILSW